MPQIFQVLRCFKCLVFQVHQTKKSNKFKCKLCGENQSIKRHYGVGIAKDCRLHVQKLNGLRQEIDELNSSIISDSDHDDPEEEKIVKLISSKKSKWSEYAEIDDEIPKENEQVECDQAMMLSDQEVELKIPKKKFKRPPPTKSTVSPDLNITMGNNKVEKIFPNENSYLFGNEMNKHDLNLAKKLKKIEQPIVPKDVNISKLVSLPNPKDIRSLSVNESKCKQIQSSLQCCSSGRASKWAQFVDSDINETDDLLESHPHVKCQNDVDTMFSLTENDVDLNKLLDF